jgi:hypothetical protein
MTLDRRTFDLNPEVYLKQVLADQRHNDDGTGLLLYNPAETAGSQFSLVRTFDIAHVFTILKYGQWERFWLHNRWATQGAVSIENTHMWSVRGVFWCHNGMLQSAPASKTPVDSMAIGHWLRDHGVQGTIDHIIKRESYANVFLIDTRNSTYYAVRCSGGSLNTDGYGNYSTSRVGELTNGVWHDSMHGRSLTEQGRLIAGIEGRKPYDYSCSTPWTPPTGGYSAPSVGAAATVEGGGEPTRIILPNGAERN